MTVIYIFIIYHFFVIATHRNVGEQVEWKFFKQLNKIFEKYPLDDAETTMDQEPEAAGRKKH